MASRMKLGALAGLAACAALGVTMLPPEPETRDAERAVPERREAWALAVQLTAANEALRRAAWSDSLAARARGAAAREVPFDVGVPATMDTSGGADWANATLAEYVGAQLDDLGIARPAVDLGVYLVEAGSHPATASVPVPAMNRFEWYAGTREGRPYCFAVRTTQHAGQIDLSSYRWQPGRSARGEPANVLGPCAIYARHGMPGPAIQRWMLEGAGGFGTETLAAFTSGTGLPGLIEARSAPSSARTWVWRRATRRGDLTFEACITGTQAACSAFATEHPRELVRILGPGDPAAREAGLSLIEARTVFNGIHSLSNLAADRMLDALERRFGADAFDRFWHSDGTLEDAFESGFGMTTAQWGSAWAHEVNGDAENAAVMPRAGDAALVVLYLCLAVGLALAVCSRRRLA